MKTMNKIATAVGPVIVMLPRTWEELDYRLDVCAGPPMLQISRNTEHKNILESAPSQIMFM